MTKGKVPGLFLMTVITLIGYWTILPLDVVPVSGMVAVKDITMMIILIHMGTLLEIDQLKREWRTVVTALAAVAGVVLVFLILAILYVLNITLYNNVIVNIPYVKLVLDKSIVSLIIGVVLGNLGILDKGVMTKTNSEGILNLSFYAFIMTFLVGAKVETIKALIVPLLIAFVLATAAIAILSVLVGKRIGYSARLSMAVGFNCFLGFPLNYLITKEAAMAVSESVEEEEKIFDALLPTMLIAGFVCVTIVSVLVAGAMTSLVK